MKYFDLTGHRALVTGGNGGLGLVMAEALCDAGAHVIATGRDKERNARVPSPIETYVLDVRNAEHVANFFDELNDLSKAPDILINNAGIYRDDSILSDDQAIRDRRGAETTWTEIIETNLTGAHRCARYAARQMRTRGSGKIINVGSTYSNFGHPASAGYASAKTGVVGLTRALAVELGPLGIQANAILPGWFPTAMNGNLPNEPRGDEIRRRTPAGRWGRPNEVGGVAVFLASRASDFVTGATVTVDGGYAVADRILEL